MMKSNFHSNNEIKMSLHDISVFKRLITNQTSIQIVFQAANNVLEVCWFIL